MTAHLLQNYLPENSLPYLQQWLGQHPIQILISRERSSKLGDYRRMPDHSHQITINSTLPPELFFFVLTHEMAHFFAFQKFGYRIRPHGREWKEEFAKMLRDSLSVYSEDLQPVILQFSKSPKASFAASTGLVKYFHTDNGEEGNFVETLKKGTIFCYRQENYKMETKLKKNYLCTRLSTGKKYVFKPLAKVKKLS